MLENANTARQRGAREDFAKAGQAGDPEYTSNPIVAQPCGLLRIVARRVWPSTKEQSNRAGLRLRWDALTEGGDVLAEATEHPLLDAAHALALRGVSGDALVTMRHAGSAVDSFAPMPLRVPAAAGAKRADDRARMAALRPDLRQHTAEAGSAGTRVPADADGALLALFDGEAAQ